MKTNRILVFLVTFASASLCSASAERPNVLVVMVDDMRFDQMTHMAHPYIQTVHLDRLASEGVRFTNAYVPSPLCGPSRASLLTGRYPSVHGRFDNATYPEALSPYLPASFHDQGYRTAMIGKFYEGPGMEESVKSGVYDLWIKNMGPDASQFKGDRSSKAFRQFRDEHLYYDQIYEVGNSKQVIKGHQTDILFDRAVQFMVEDSNRPFMVFLTPFAPHAPFNPTLRRKGKYSGKGIPLRPNVELGVGYMTESRTRQMQEAYERSCEMIEDVDEGIGKVLNALDKKGVLNDTIIVFTSDNGVLFGEHGFGWKRHPWEEAVKIPLLIRYPRAFKPDSVNEDLVSISDIFVTSADLCKVELPPDDKRYGISLKNRAAGSEGGKRDTLLMVDYEADSTDPSPGGRNLSWASMVTADGWKLIRYREHPPENMRPDFGNLFLFNLKQDPMELNNLADQPEHASQLKKLNSRMLEKLRAGGAKADWLESSN